MTSTPKWTARPLIAGILTSESHHISLKLPLQEPLTLGRDPGCSFTFHRNRSSISNIHCIVQATLTTSENDGEHFVVLLKDVSTNGTFINGKRVVANEDVELVDGAVLHFGGCPASEFALNFELFRLGSIHAEFDFQRNLGAGGYGAVSQYRSRLTGVDYAVKIVDNRVIPSQRNRVLEELTAYKTIKHDKVIRLFAYEKDKKYLYFLLELAPHGSLYDLIMKQTRLAEGDVRIITKDICEALEHMHKKRIAHRDIKPQNILVKSVKPLETKVADLGFTRPFTGASIDQTVCGTSIYMAPEVVMAGMPKVPRYNWTADNWSVGVTVFEMLAGRPPFSRQDMAFNHVTKRVDERTIDWTLMPDNVTNDAREVVRALLIQDPKKRMSASQVLAHRWMVGV